MKLQSATNCSALALSAALCLTQPAPAQSFDGHGYASDITADVRFTGSLGDSAFSETVNAGPVAGVSGSIPFNENFSGSANTDYESSVTLAQDLEGSVTIPARGPMSLGASSYGVATPDNAEVASSMFSAPTGSVTVSAGDTSLFTVDIDPGYFPTTSASVTWDGTTFTPTTHADLLLIGELSEKVSITVLGVPMSVPGLPPGAQSVSIPVGLISGGAIATGTISLHPDAVTSSVSETAAMAAASTLMVDFNLTFSVLNVPVPYSTAVVGNMAFGSAFASLAIVPEPSGAVLLLAGTLMALRRFRKG